MNYFEAFMYIDFYWDHPETGKHSKWMRMLARDVPKTIVRVAGGSNCFMSVQRFGRHPSLTERL